MTSPSEPVESREQPRGTRSQSSTPAKSPWPEAESSAPHAPRNYPPQNATIRNLETLRDVHRRTIDDLISEAQTAGATIDELRAEVADLKSHLAQQGWRADQ